MEKINFNLNSIDLEFGRQPVNVKHNVDIYSEIRHKFSYIQDWISIEGLFHKNDEFFYLDNDVIKEWNLEKFDDIDENILEVIIPSQLQPEIVSFYKLKIYNPKNKVFDDIKCIPFKNLYKLLKVKILVPYQ